MNSLTKHQPSAITELNNVTVRPILAYSDNYIWLIEDSQSKQLWLVDPGEATPVLNQLESFPEHKLAGILITHHHDDHIGGINSLLDKYPDTPVFGIQSKRVPQVTVPVTEGESLSLSPNVTLEVISVPGHTRDHIVYFRPDDQQPLLFSGDTLFASGCGRLFEGSPSDMLSSLKKLRQLPSNTLVFCAHEYTTSNLAFAEAVEPNSAEIQQRIASVNQLRENDQPSIPTVLSTEFDVNPFLRWDRPSVIDKACELAQVKNLTEAEVFTEIRKWKDRF
ncbi:hydroxyacylglutathione hydrolase [Sessilibacter corallicola]|uniref:Hydroxyacylglutathione hydrolase n=1 Tax=Sessilibacter corallicola TaxID=2904075 RepID=A0ABQ0AA12_9GAMM